MVVANEELKHVEESIVELVQASDRPYRPVDVVRELRQRGFREDLIRAAVWFLVDARRITFTRDRTLGPVPETL